jgi:hypothetical protein
VPEDRRPQGPARAGEQRYRVRAPGIRPRQLSYARTVEAYLRGQTPPRYMLRLGEIDAEYRAQLRALEAAYEALREACGPDARRFAADWIARVRSWSFESLNSLVREHNAWYPLEVDLPMDPRTRDFVPVHGRSYRRMELGAEWVLEHFPAERAAGDEPPAPPSRAPREPL